MGFNGDCPVTEWCKEVDDKSAGYMYFVFMNLAQLWTWFQIENWAAPLHFPVEP